MKRELPLGLVVEGNSTESAILRLPNLAEELGPVKSTALRLARRLCNFLRAGYAVSEYQDLQAARLILLRVPDEAVTRVVSELCASELLFKDLSFVLCESWLTSDELEPLRALGASIATMVNARTARRKWFIVEGDTGAVRQIRRVIERNDARALELRSGTKYLYFAAELLAATLPQPLFAASQQSLRLSGISGNHLYSLLEDLTEQMFATVLRGARSKWGGPLTECPPEVIRTYLEAIRKGNSDLAALIDEHLPFVLKRLSEERKS